MKKILSVFLLLTLVSGINIKFAFAQEDNSNSLYQFISDNKDFKANFEYPSLKISSDYRGNKLNARTPVIIRSNEEINTKTLKSGDSINFSVVQDVTDEKGRIFIKANTPVSANITFKPKEYIGRSAEITITDFHTRAVDDTYVPLSSTISVEPEDKMVLSIVLSTVLCPLFLLMKGRNAILPEGTVKGVYTLSDVYVKTVNL